MEFNATFSNISVISWRSDLLVENTGVPGGNKPSCILWQVTDKLYHIKWTRRQYLTTLHRKVRLCNTNLTKN